MVAVEAKVVEAVETKGGVIRLRQTMQLCKQGKVPAAVESGGLESDSVLVVSALGVCSVSDGAWRLRQLDCAFALTRGVFGGLQLQVSPDDLR